MKFTFQILCLILTTTLLHAQEKETGKVSVTPFSAQFMLSTDFSAVCFNLVGTGLKYTKKNVVISISIFPTLTFREDHPPPGESKRPFVRPTFALGPLFQYKRMMIGFPSYYQDDEWHFSAGLGIKIGN